MVLSYKIRNKETGLFSTGGYHPHWTTKGKTWARYSDMKGHLSYFKKPLYGDTDVTRPKVYDNCEVVEYELIEKVCVDIEHVNDLSAEGKRRGPPTPKRGRIERVVEDVSSDVEDVSSDVEDVSSDVEDVETNQEPFVHRKSGFREALCGARDRPKEPNERIILSADFPLVTCPECVARMRRKNEEVQ